MNITQAARNILLDQLVHIAKTGNADALQQLLSGAGLPVLVRDAEAAEQIYDALESGDNYATLARRIAHLLAGLIRRRADTLAHELAVVEGAAIGGGNALVYNNLYLEDEPYVFNLFLLASRLPRREELFDGLQRFHEVGFKQEVMLVSVNNRVGFQLRRALAEQQHDSGLRGYWLDLLQSQGRDWTPARRTELLEAWHGLLATMDFDADQQDTLCTLDAGLRALHGSVEHHPEAIGLLEMALWRLENAYPLAPATWLHYLAPAWAIWPELLRDVAARFWPGLEPKPLDDMPPLPDDLATLWAAMGENEQTALLDFLHRNAAEEGRNYLKDLQFSPPKITGQPPQTISTMLNRLGEHLWPVGGKAVHNMPQHENEKWDDTETARSRRRPSVDRLARLEAVNRTLAEIERRLNNGDESAARRFLDTLLEQQRGALLADQHLHTAKTLAKAATIIQHFGMLEWAESLLREACLENHDDEVSACGLADVLKARGELDAAEAQYRQNTARWPNDEVSACGLADVLKARGELDAAEAQYRQNTARWPNNEVSACGLADVLKARGELDAAEAQYRQNTARWPNDEVSANGLADVLKARGELDAAEAQYRQNTAHWPNSRVAVNGLANVLRKQKRHAEALSLLPISEKIPVTTHDRYDLHLRAMILLDLGRLADARTALDQGLRAAITQNEVVVFQRGLALLALRAQDFEQADKILSTLPSNVIPLDLIRLHFEAMQNHSDAAGRLTDTLAALQPKMNFGESQVFRLVRKGFDLSAAGVGRQPLEPELDEIFDAEIELQLAA